MFSEMLAQPQKIIIAASIGAPRAIRFINAMFINQLFIYLTERTPLLFTPVRRTIHNTPNHYTLYITPG